MMLTPKHRRSKRVRDPPKRYNDTQTHTRSIKTDVDCESNNKNSKTKNQKK
jgi:hypothetical protein